MLIACWSAKGGVGTTVVAAALALLLAAHRRPWRRAGRPGRRRPRRARPARAGVARASAGWLAAGDRVPADALARIEVEVAPGLALLPRGDGALVARAGRGAGRAARRGRPPGGRRLRPGRPTAARGGRRGRSGRRARCSSPGPAIVALRRASAGPGAAVRGRARHRAGPRAVRAATSPSAAEAPVVAEVAARPAGGPRSSTPGCCAGRLPSLAAPGLRVPRTLTDADRSTPGCTSGCCAATADQPLDDDALAALVRGRGAAARRGRRRRASSTGCGPASAASGPLEPLLADPAVSDVLVNGPGPVWVERARPARAHRRRASTGRRSTCSSSGSSRRWACGPTGRTPVVDARLPDGSRVHVVLPPLAVDGPAVTIRRFGGDRRAARPSSARPTVAGLLADAVAAGLNIVVSGRHRRREDDAAQRPVPAACRRASAS